MFWNVLDGENFKGEHPLNSFQSLDCSIFPREVPAWASSPECVAATIRIENSFLHLNTVTVSGRFNMVQELEVLCRKDASVLCSPARPPYLPCLWCLPGLGCLRCHTVWPRHCHFEHFSPRPLRSHPGCMWKDSWFMMIDDHLGWSRMIHDDWL